MRKTAVAAIALVTLAACGGDTVYVVQEPTTTAKKTTTTIQEAPASELEIHVVIAE